MILFVVTGGTGFIGRPLVRKLLDNGHGVILLTRDLTKTKEWQFDERVIVVQVTTDNPESLRDQLNLIKEPVAGIFHLAANQKYLGSRSVLYRDNVHFTELLLQWAADRKLGFFVYASSIDAMGPNPSNNSPASEKTPCQPGSVYGWSKKMAESIVAKYSAKIRTVSLRLSNVYGPGSRFIIIDIAKAIQEGSGNPLIRYYHQIKKQLVHLCYIDDVIDGIYNTAFAKFKSGEVYILAGEKPTAIETLFQVVADTTTTVFNPPAEKVLPGAFIALRQWYYFRIKKKVDRVTYFNMGNWFVSAEKARQQLLFQPTVTLTAGVQATINQGWH